MKSKSPIQINNKAIERSIYIIRGQEVMLDSDLAELYEVPTKVLNQAVRRNIKRFPPDFMFRLTKDEAANLTFQSGISSLRSQFATSNENETGALNRSQSVTGSQKHRDPRYFPYAFTEHGIAMLSSVLNSERAIQMNIFIIRAFIELRQTLSANKELAKRLKRIEGIVKLHDDVLSILTGEVSKIKNPPKHNAIGFKT